MPPLMTWRVVSSPPTRISSDSCSTSSGVEAVAVDLGVHEDAHEVVGRVRLPLRDRVRAERRCTPSSRSSPATYCSSVALPLCALTMSSDQRRRSSRSSGATPSMSPIMIIGSGAAMSRTKSHSPRSHTWSMIASHDVADLLLAVADAAGREAPVDELAALPVLRVVHVDHHRDRTGVGPDAARVRERLRVLRRREHRRVRRETPHAVAWRRSTPARCSRIHAYFVAGSST